MGRIVFEKNSKMLAMAMEASVVVSSVLKKYPIVMPNRINTVAKIKMISSNGPMVCNNVSLKKYKLTNNRIMTCNATMNKFVT